MAKIGLTILVSVALSIAISAYLSGPQLFFARILPPTEPIQAPLFLVRSNPDLLANRVVAVRGIIDTGRYNGSPALYLTRDQFNYGDLNSAILISEIPEQCQNLFDDLYGKYVRVNGVFDARNVSFREVISITEMLWNQEGYEPDKPISDAPPLLRCGSNYNEFLDGRS